MEMSLKQEFYAWKFAKKNPGNIMENQNFGIAEK